VTVNTSTWRYFVLCYFTSSIDTIYLLNKLFIKINICIWQFAQLWFYFHLLLHHFHVNICFPLWGCNSLVACIRTDTFTKNNIHFIFKQVHNNHIRCSIAINIKILNDIPGTEIHSEILNN
jgi:hypothetical protein